MAMRITNHYGSFMVRVGSYSAVTLNSGVDVYPFSFVAADPVLVLLNGTTHDLGWFPVEDTLNFYRDRGPYTDVRASYEKPSPIPYDSTDDFRKYGSFLSSLASAGALLRGEDLIRFVPDNEHGVLHRNVVGDLSAASVVDFLDYDQYTSPAGNVPFWGNMARPAYTHPAYGNGYYNHQMSCYPGIDGYTFFIEVDRSQAWFPTSDMRTVMEYIVQQSEGGWSHDYAGMRMTISDASLVVAQRFLKLMYHFSWVYLDDPDHPYEVDTTITSQLEYSGNVPSNGHLDPSLGPQLLEIGSLGDYRMTVYRHVTNPTSAPPFATFRDGYTYDQTEHNFVYLSEAQQPDGTGNSTFDLPGFFNRQRFFQRFYDSVEDRIEDIRLSCLQSSSKALDDLTNAIGADNFQTLSKLTAIQESLPDVVRAAKAIGALRSDPIRSMGELLDVATEIRLQSAFQWDPNWDFLTELLPKMRALLELLDSRSSGTVVGRGNFSFTFPTGEFGREESVLRVHSKVIATRDANSALETVLNLRALGFPLTPSSAWDLTPLSFVANWFTGVGSRIRDAEAAGFLIASGVQCYVHSYRVISKLTDDEMATEGFVPDGMSLDGAYPSLVYYLREPTRHPPRFRDGRYDFRLPTHLPDWAIAGSLAWQLLL